MLKVLVVVGWWVIENGAGSCCAFPPFCVRSTQARSCARALHIPFCSHFPLSLVCGSEYLLLSFLGSVLLRSSALKLSLTSCLGSSPPPVYREGSFGGLSQGLSRHTCTDPWHPQTVRPESHHPGPTTRPGPSPVAAQKTRTSRLEAQFKSGGAHSPGFVANDLIANTRPGGAFFASNCPNCAPAVCLLNARVQTLDRSHFEIEDG